MRGQARLARLVRWSSTKKSDFASAQYGRSVAGSDESLANNLHQMSRGKFEYLNDFIKSLNRGPVKLGVGAKSNAPLSEKERAREAAQAQAVALMSRAMMLGTAACFGGGLVGWWLLKLYLGVASVGEFGEYLKEKLPKVKDTPGISDTLKQANETSRDAISESDTLASLRRSVRTKFNTEEGARVARQNSVEMAEARARERIARKTSAKKAAAPSAPAATVAAAAADDVEPARAPAADDAADAATPTLLRRLSQHILPPRVDTVQAGDAKLGPVRSTSKQSEGTAEDVAPGLMRRLSQHVFPPQTKDVASPVDDAAPTLIRRLSQQMSSPRAATGDASQSVPLSPGLLVRRLTRSSSTRVEIKDDSSAVDASALASTQREEATPDLGPTERS